MREYITLALVGGCWLFLAAVGVVHAGEPTPRPLTNPQDPISYGADPTGKNDSSAAFRNAASAGDIDVPPGNFLINSNVILGARNLRCESGATLIQTAMAQHFMLMVSGSGSVFNCHFRGPYADTNIPGFNLFPEDFIHLTPPSSGYQIVGNDFNGSAGWTGAIDVYTRGGTPATDFEIGWNTFEHCAYYAVQVTSGQNGLFDNNTAQDCAGFVEADTSSQMNTGNVADSNHFTFIYGTGWTNHGAGRWASEFTCGQSASGNPYDYAGNLCENNIIDGPHASVLAESPASGGVAATYINNTCTGGCIVN